jgi:Zn finger protein HypA/HybF involved in hydrogenase expression
VLRVIRMAKSPIKFEKIKGIKKIIRCKSCNKRIEVSNFNRMLCERCGYREGRVPVKTKA